MHLNRAERQLIVCIFLHASNDLKVLLRSHGRKLEMLIAASVSLFRAPDELSTGLPSLVVAGGGAGAFKAYFGIEMTNGIPFDGWFGVETVTFVEVFAASTIGEKEKFGSC